MFSVTVDDTRDETPMFIQLSLVIIGLAAGCISGRCPPCNDEVFEVVPFHAMVVESLQDLRGGRKFRTTRDKELDLVTRVCPRVRDSSHLISSHSPGFSCPQPQLTIFCPGLSLRGRVFLLVRRPSPRNRHECWTTVTLCSRLSNQLFLADDVHGS